MMRSRVLGGRCRSINSNYRFFPRKSRNRQGRPLSHARNSFVLAGTGRAATIPVVLARSKNAGDRNLAIFEFAWWRLIPRRSSISERYPFGGRHEPIIILRPTRVFSGVAGFLFITVPPLFSIVSRMFRGWQQGVMTVDYDMLWAGTRLLI